MVMCPVCHGAIDADEDEIDEGDPISCDECGASLKVVSTKPLELESAEELEDEDDEEFLDADEEEEEEELDEDWR